MREQGWSCGKTHSTLSTSRRPKHSHPPCPPPTPRQTVAPTQASSHQTQAWHLFKCSFDQKPTEPNIRRLRDFLKSLPWEEYQVCWKRGNDVLEATPIRGLEKCSSPDRRTFLNKVEGKRGSVGHFRSPTGMSRLVIPLKPYTHMACFVKEATMQEFQDMTKLIHDLVRQSPLHDIRVFTHGLDVDWLHVKIRPDPLW